MSKDAKSSPSPTMDPSAYIQSLSEDKYDPTLGKKVQAHLVQLGIENPMSGLDYAPKEATQAIEMGIKLGLSELGINMLDPSMADTPRRYASMVVGELTRGLCYELFPKCTATPNGQALAGSVSQFVVREGAYNQMVLVDHIQVLSLCEHHLQTIDGFCHIAYIPDKKLLGLSKFARVTEFFSRRPQVQERLTDQIYHALSYILGTQNIGVVIKATHYCMRARGAMQHASQTTTDKMGGLFLSNPALRQEMMDAIRK